MRSTSSTADMERVRGSAVLATPRAPSPLSPFKSGAARASPYARVALSAPPCHHEAPLTSAQPKSQSGSRTSNPRHSAAWRPACSGDAHTRVRASDAENRAAFRASPRQPAGLFRPSSFAARGEWRRLSQLTSAHLGSISAPLDFTAVLWLCFLWALSVLKPAGSRRSEQDPTKWHFSREAHPISKMAGQTEKPGTPTHQGFP